MTKTRIEEDSLGKVKVPSDKYWGAQTQRSKDNFIIGSQKIPIELIRAHALVKKACALTNSKLGLLTVKKKNLIVRAADEVIEGKLDDHFPLAVWQTGSGTQSNMNVNEVISNRAIEMAKGKMGSKKPIHPNDDVNMSQSTNDTFPTSIHIASCLLIHNALLPNLEILHRAFVKKAEEFKDIIKVGRTHWMDATPITLGQEFSGYAQQIKNAIEEIKRSLKDLKELPIGGTAVGTGMNTHPKFAKTVVTTINELTKYDFVNAPNRFEGISSKDACVRMSGSFRALSVSLTKIATDLSVSSSGPRSGIGELRLPENEPGSSIMPGKTNPTQCEALLMVAAQVMGHDLAISIAGMQGHFQLNTFMPLIAYDLIHSIHLLSDVSLNFAQKCLYGIEPDLKRIEENLEKNLILATALNKELGYDTASKIVKLAYKKNKTLKEAASDLKLVSEKHFSEIVDPKKMIRPR